MGGADIGRKTNGRRKEQTMGVDKEYIIEHCQDKQRLYGIDICMLQTEPCKRAVEQNRCPKMWWMKGADDDINNV